MQSLDELRQEIDTVNNDILALFLRRMELTEKVADYKRANSLPVLNTAREREIIRDMSEKAKDSHKNQTTMLFEAIMAAGRSAQYRGVITGSGKARELSSLINAASPSPLPTNAMVACQGAPGAFSHMAALSAFKRAAITFYHSFKETAASVLSGENEFGLLPLENSVAGSVSDSLDAINATGLFIRRMVLLPVEHCLLGISGASLESVTDIFSHEQALSQCRDYLDSMAGIRRHQYINTAAAARFIATERNPHFAAIACEGCADIYPELSVLAKGVQDSKRNFTRFAVVGREFLVEPAANRISISFELPHTEGALFRLLSLLSSFGVNMTKLQNQPLRSGDFSVRFYCELEGTVLNNETAGLICGLCEELSHFKLLGCYNDDSIN